MKILYITILYRLLNTIKKPSGQFEFRTLDLPATVQQK